MNITLILSCRLAGQATTHKNCDDCQKRYVKLTSPEYSYVTNVMAYSNVATAGNAASYTNRTFRADIHIAHLKVGGWYIVVSRIGNTFGPQGARPISSSSASSMQIVRLECKSS